VRVHGTLPRWPYLAAAAADTAPCGMLGVFARLKNATVGVARSPSAHVISVHAENAVADADADGVPLPADDALGRALSLFALGLSSADVD
jgi:hypothetical protein